MVRQNQSNYLDSLVLYHDGNGTALFNVTGMTAGQSEAKCIEVTYEKSKAATQPVKLYGSYVDTADSNDTTDSALVPYLDLSLEVAAAGTADGSSTGWISVPIESTLAAFVASSDSWSKGVATGWTPQAIGDGNPATSDDGEARQFRIAMKVQNNNDAQGKAAEPAFTWEVHS